MTKVYTDVMTRVCRSVVVALAAALFVVPAFAQQRRPPAKKQAPQAKPTAPPKTTTPETRCPSLIGMGVKTIRSFCDVPAGTDPAQGIVVSLPPHTGPATLSFDLHARHTYSEEQTKSGKGFAQYQAVISIVTPKGDVISRAAIQTEFRSANDLFDRIGGGAGPGGLKAVAPAGHEQVYVTIPAGVTEVSLLGDSLDAITPAGHETVVMPGRPVAIVSNLLVEYRPK
jgi:hypothetical protein